MTSSVEEYLHDHVYQKSHSYNARFDLNFFNNRFKAEYHEYH